MMTMNTKTKEMTGASMPRAVSSAREAYSCKAKR